MFSTGATDTACQTDIPPFPRRNTPAIYGIFKRNGDIYAFSSSDTLYIWDIEESRFVSVGPIAINGGGIDDPGSISGGVYDPAIDKYIVFVRKFDDSGNERHFFSLFDFDTMNIETQFELFGLRTRQPLTDGPIVSDTGIGYGSSEFSNSVGIMIKTQMISVLECLLHI